MIAAIGIIISLYVFTRYLEIFDKSTWKGKMWLIIVMIITVIMALFNFFGSSSPNTIQ